METRIATTKDVGQICRLCDEFFAYNADLQPEYYIAAKETGDYPRSIITSENADILVAVENNVIVGFIHISKAQTPPFDSVMPHNYAEIIGCFVTASHRKKGIGAELMDFARRWGKEQNLDCIELCVLSNAKEALDFYKQQGFNAASHNMRCAL